MGSKGDPPVPSGHWPDGTGKTLQLERGAWKSSDALPIPSGGSPLGTGQWPVLASGRATPISDVRLNREFRRSGGRPLQLHPQQRLVVQKAK